MSVAKRLVEFHDYLKSNGYGGRNVFECAIGKSSGYLTTALKKNTSIGSDVLEVLISKFPELNIDWLLSGNGSMLNKEIMQPIDNTRPRIPYDAAAGTLTDAVDGVSNYQCEQVPVVSAFPRYDFTIRVVGKSMEPEYYSGDEVACLRINENRFIQWGRVHVLDTTQGVVIKRIYDGGETIICKSYNPEFPDFYIPKEDIRSYNLVVGSLRL